VGDSTQRSEASWGVRVILETVHCDWKAGNAEIHGAGAPYSAQLLAAQVRTVLPQLFFDG
jgi:hypothetical protein